MDPNQVNLNLFLSYLQNSNFPKNPNIQNSQFSNFQNPNRNPIMQCCSPYFNYVILQPIF